MVARVKGGRTGVSKVPTTPGARLSQGGLRFEDARAHGSQDPSLPRWTLTNYILSTEYSVDLGIQPRSPVSTLESHPRALMKEDATLQDHFRGPVGVYQVIYHTRYR